MVSPMMHPSEVFRLNVKSDMAPTFVIVRRHGGLRRQKAWAAHGIAVRSRSSGCATGTSTIGCVFDLPFGRWFFSEQWRSGPALAIG